MDDQWVEKITVGMVGIQSFNDTVVLTAMLARYW